MPGQWRWTRRADAQSSAAQAPAGSGAGSEALDKLLGEVRDLRLTFVTDLSMAAGAVEAGATDVAADILDADRAELARFFRVADDRLRELEQAAHREPAGNVVPMPARRRSTARRRVAVALPAIPLVGALTMAAAAAAGVLPVPGTSTGNAHHGASASAAENSALRQFETVVNSDPSEQQVIAAANKLHQQIVALIKTSNGDPSQARAIAQLLQAEKALLLSKEPPGTQAVLALMSQLAHHTTTLIKTPTLSTQPADVTTQSNPASSKPTASPSPSKTAKPSPTPTHSSSPSPSPSPSSSSDSGPLPKVGG